MNHSKMQCYKVTELREIAKKNNLRRYSHLKKAELIDLLISECADLESDGEPPGAPPSKETMVLTRMTGGAFREFPLNDRVTTVGRSPDNDIALEDSIVSRQHCIISCEEDIWTISDLDSKNGSYVNDLSVKKARLQSGDRIRLGSTQMIFSYANQPFNSYANLPVKSPDAARVLNANLKESLSESIAIIENPDRYARDWNLLNQYVFQLLTLTDHEDAVRTAFDIIFSRTQATVIGFDSVACQLAMSRNQTEGIEIEKSYDDTLSQPTYGNIYPLRTRNHEYAFQAWLKDPHSNHLIGTLKVFMKYEPDEADIAFVSSVARILECSLVRLSPPSDDEITPENSSDESTECQDRQTPISVFISCASEDRRWRDRLVQHLSVLRLERNVQSWHDGLITAGQNRADEVRSKLDSSQIILLMVSSSFLASNECYETARYAVSMRQDKLRRVVPVIIHACEWRESCFGQLNAIPSDEKPISSWRIRDDAFVEIIRSIRTVVEDIRRKVQESKT